MVEIVRDRPVRAATSTVARTGVRVAGRARSDGTARVGSVALASGMAEREAVWPAKRMVMTRGRRIGNAVAGALTRLGVIPHTVMMTTVGRKTGRPHRLPVTLVQHGDQIWLVAPYGPVDWVRNARAAGRVSLQGRAASGEFSVTELAADAAGPILKEYLGIAGAVRPYFTATTDSPVEAFVAEAPAHPVFALSRI